MEKLKTQYAKPWLKDNFAVTYLDDSEKSASALTNSTSFRSVMLKMGARFSSRYRKKAHLWKYIELGMDEMEFTEAESNLCDHGCEYIEYGGRFNDDDEGCEE